MADEGSGTRYVARVLLLDEAARERREKLGLHDGWNAMITQLDDFAVTLK
ncbi:hypothetical protein ACQUFY_20430 [Robbsia andropogonis]